MKNLSIDLIVLISNNIKINYIWSYFNYKYLKVRNFKKAKFLNIYFTWFFYVLKRIVYITDNQIVFLNINLHIAHNVARVFDWLLDDSESAFPSMQKQNASLEDRKE